MADIIDPFRTPDSASNAGSPGNIVDPFAQQPSRALARTESKPTGFVDAAVRGFKRSLPETKSLGYGAVAAGAGAVGADGIRDWGLENYRRVQRDEVEPLQNQSTFKGSLKGESSFGEWAGDTLGNFAGQAAQSAVTGAAGALVGGATGAPAGGIGAAPGAIAGAVGGVAARGAVKKAITESAEKLVKDQVAKGVGRKAAEAAGQQLVRRRLAQVGGSAIGATGLNVGQEVGIAYTGRADDAQQSGENLTQGDALRAIGWGVPAGLVDTVAEGIIAERLLGGASASSSRVRRMLSGAAKGAATEGATEGVQAVMERAGAGQELTGTEAYDDYLENVAAGALGGSVPGAASGIRRSLPPNAPGDVTPSPEPAPPPALPAPEPITVDAGGNAVTPEQEYQRQQVLRQRENAQPIIDGEFTDVTPAAPAADATQGTSIPVPPGPATYEQRLANVALDARDAQEARRKDAELDALARDSRLPAALRDAEQADALRRAAGEDAVAQAPTAMQLAMQRARSDAENRTPTLPDGSPVPEPTNGPLSRAANVGVANGAVQQAAQERAIAEAAEVSAQQERQARGRSTQRPQPEPAQSQPSIFDVDQETGEVLLQAGGQEAALRDRIAYLRQQARQSGWTKAMVDDRRAAENELRRLAAATNAETRDAEPAGRSEPERNVAQVDAVDSGRVPGEAVVAGQPAETAGASAQPPATAAAPDRAQADALISDAQEVPHETPEATWRAAGVAAPTQAGAGGPVAGTTVPGTAAQPGGGRGVGTVQPVAGVQADLAGTDAGGDTQPALSAPANTYDLPRVVRKKDAVAALRRHAGLTAEQAESAYLAIDRGGLKEGRRPRAGVAAAIEQARQTAGAGAVHAQAETVAPQASTPVLATPVEQAASEAATSPANDRPAPTEAQREAGNFKVGRLKVGGLNISIEHPAGVARAEGRQPLAHAYGYIRRSEAADGDHVDAYLGPNAADEKNPVYVVDQVDQDGNYDEAKVMMGFGSSAEARAAYLANYPDGWTGLGGMRKMSAREFREWISDPEKTRKPVSVKVAKAARSERDTGHRLPTQAAPESILALRSEIGWAERGGRLLRERQDTDDGETTGADAGRNSGEVSGRTKWIAHPGPDGSESMFWRNRPVKLNEAGARTALDKFERGEQLTNREQRFIDYADQTATTYEEMEQQAAAEWDAAQDANQGAGEFIPGFEEDGSANLYDLLDRAAELGATQEQINDAAYRGIDAATQLVEELGNGQEGEQAGRVDRSQEGRTGEEEAGREEGDESGEPGARAQDFQLESERSSAAGEVTPPSTATQGGLFAPPTAREQVQDAQRQRDAERDGRTGTGRTDMAAGDGELFAGPRPEQADVATEEGTATRADSAGKPGDAKIEDFGETLQGARKHYAAEYARRMGDAEGLDIAAHPLSETWPEPDYAKLLEGGADPRVVAFVHAARDEVPAKPKKGWKLKGWAEKVSILRDTSNQLLSGEIDSERLLSGLASASAQLRGEVIGRMELYQEVGHDRSLKGISVHAATYSVFDRQVYDPPRTFWTVEAKAKASAFGNWPRIMGQGDTKADAIAAFKKRLDAEKEAPAKAKGTVRFDIYTRRHVELAVPRSQQKVTIHIGKKVGKEHIDLATFDTIEQARQYLQEHQADLESKLEQMKNLPSERGDTNAPRVGIDHRAGGDVAPEQFSEAFGFRGVQFGNYVEGARRQQDLNQAYDALMDLAGVLGVPPRALSLNGTLGLAFGARGKGGKNPALAHYEPGNIVINLTKRAGAGSLAHEWFHGLDNYFSRMRGRPSEYVTSDPNGGPAQAGMIRPEMVRAFNGIMAAIRASGLPQRSRKLDRLRSKPYWATDLEMAARSFENYVIAKLQDQGASNDYLANIVSDEAWLINYAQAAVADDSATVENTYPYLTPDEVPAVRAAFDEFFQTIESESSVDGAVRLFSRPDGVARGGMSIDHVRRAIAQVTQGWGDNAPRVEVVENAEGLPERVKADPAYRTAEGLYDDATGTVYLVAANLRDARRAQEVLAHEAVGHYGVEAITGPALWNDIQRTLDNMRAGGRHTELFAEVGRRYRGANRDIAAREAVAVMAEKGIRNSVVDRAVAALRRFLRSLGFNLQFSEAELRQLLVAAARYVRDGARPRQAAQQAQGEGLAFSRTDINLNREVPVVGLAGGMFGDTVRDTANARRRAKEYLRKLRDSGRTMRNEDTGWQIGLSGRSIGEITSWNSEKLNLIAALPRITKVAVLANSEGNKKPRAHVEAGEAVRAMHTLYAPVRVNGELRIARLVVRETVNGNYAYDLQQSGIVNEENPAGTARFPGSILGASQNRTGLTAMTVAQLRDAVNAVDRPGWQWSRADPVGSPAFRRWFSDSKVVDAAGQPKVVYHGTASDFWSFDRNRLAESTGHMTAPLGFFFDEKRSKAQSYAENAADGVPADERVIDAFLSIQNPARMSLDDFLAIDDYDQARALRARLQRKGHDGIHLADVGQWVAFEPEQVKSASENRGTYDAASSDIRFSKPDPDAFVNAVDGAFAGPPPSLVDRLKEMFRGLTPANLRENTRPAWLGALTLRHLAELGNDLKLKQVGEYADRVQRMATDRNIMQEEAGAIADGWEAFQRKDRAGADATANLMHDSTIDGVDPSKAYEPLRTGTTKRGGDEAVTPESIARRKAKVAAERKQARSSEALGRLDTETQRLDELLAEELKRQSLYPELVRRFRALPEAGQKLYRDARDAYVKQSERMEDALVARIDALEIDGRQKAAMVAQLRQQFETARLNGPYFPLQRFGDFWISAESKTGEPAFFMYERVQDWREAQRDLEARGYTIKKAGRKLDEARGLAGASGGFMADLQNLLQTAGVDDDTRDGVYQLYLRTLPDLSIRKHQIHRKATTGYSKDALRAFSANAFHGSFQVARLRHSHELEADLLAMKAEVERLTGEDPERAAKAAALYTEMNKRHEWVMNPRDSKAVSGLTSLGFAWYLGTTPAAALVNLTQTAIVTFPVLASRYGAARAFNALSSSMGQALRSATGDITRSMTPEEQAAYKLWRESGAIDKTQAHNLAGLSETDSRAFSPVTRRGMEVISWMFHKTETVNREATALAAFRLARQGGQGFHEAVKYAADVITESHFDYSNANRARWMQSNAAKVLLLFRQYSLNMTWFLWRNLYQSLKGEDKQVRHEARVKLAGIMGMTGVFAGALGMPLTSVMFGLANAAAAAFGDDDDEPFDAEVAFRNLLADLLGPDVARIIARGPVDYFTGANISGRVSLNDLWLREPNRELEGKAQANYLLEQAAGPLFGGMLVNTLRGLQQVQDGHTWRGVETMMPKALKDGMKALRYTTQGVNTLRGDPVIEDLGVGGSLLQLAGFSPASLNERYDGINAAKNYEEKILDRRSSLLNAYAMAWRAGDAEAVGKVIGKIRAFNEAQPSLAISTSTIRQSMQSRLRYSSRAEGGVVLNPKIAERAREQARFAE